MSVAPHPSPAAVALELTGRDYLSYSAISTYQTCPLRYFFRYVLGWVEPTVSCSLVFGGAIHAAVEHHHRELMLGNPPPPRDTLLQVFRHAWREREQAAEVRYHKGEDTHSMLVLAGRMLTAFAESDAARPDGQIIGVEEQLCGPISADVPELLARIDLLVETDEQLLVVDLKTARSGWSAEQADDNASQLLLYSLLARQLAPQKTVALRFLVLTKTRSPVVQQHTLPAEACRVERIKTVARRVWHAIEQQHFYPAPSPMACGSCAFREPCRQWSG